MDTNIKDKIKNELDLTDDELEELIKDNIITINGNNYSISLDKTELAKYKYKNKTEE